MKKIGGNLTVELQVRSVIKNEMGEQEATYKTICELKGFLDSNGGDSKYTTYDAKIQESSHVFICDYKELGENIKSENTRIFVPKNGKCYDVMLIDNPQELNYHLEFYLKFVGGQNS